MTTNYERGAIVERDVRDALQASGYYAIRGAGSKGIADVVAFRPGEVLMIQCKRNGALGPAERRALLDAAGLYGAVPLVAGFTGPRGSRLEFRRLVEPGGPRDAVAWIAGPGEPSGV